MRQNNKKKNTFVAENAGGSHFFCNLHPISEKASIGEMLEWLKRHAWKACIPLKGIRGSNPVSPLNVLDRNGQQTDKKLQINDLWLFLLPESPASKTSKVR